MNEPAQEIPEVHNEGDWDKDGRTDVIATLLVVTVLVLGGVFFVAGA